ncbi:glycosyltransferase family 2 protein [Microbacterium bovistercoris]|uniref:Glycosyltransferase family 2 protein n=1 Tax=Microbacterium bovistercoris TaxID=2293570 RepID=A0A371NP13_9MICO|nr:glycosyltransferase family 2 protein [Microbacterium bovistercoris]REJ03916.1 glycosyltransferase family 2 protein [Microbacterium bovistercoris]
MDSAVDVVLPCLNEADALPGVLSGIPVGWRAIVVDNGSSDGSAEIAARLGATVVPAAQRGYGAAVHAGLTAATAPIVAFCDADGSFDTRQLERVVAPVRAGTEDLMLGRRVPVRSGAWPVHARFANAALLWWVRRRLDVDVHDLGPMRAGDRARLLALGLEDRRSGYPLELLLRARRAGWRIGEVPVDYLPRIGRSKVTGTVRGTLQAVRDMSRMLRRYA